MIRAALTSLFCLTAVAVPAQDLNFFSLGSGTVSGGYFSAARSICERINRQEAGAMRCSPEPTPGSIYNLRMLSGGELDFAFTQSDWQLSALQGTDLFAGDRAIPEIRSVASLYPETLTMLVREGVEVATPRDLAGKSVDIGLPASGRNASFRRLMTLLQTDSDMFGRLDELNPESAVNDICAGRLDVTVLITGHPNSLIARALRDCDARLVGFSGPRVDPLFETDASFSRNLIPIDTYPQLTADIRSWAVMATIVARGDTDAETVERFVSILLDSLEPLAASNPLFEGLTPDAIRTRGMSAPLHPGAERAFDAALAPVTQ